MGSQQMVKYIGKKLISVVLMLLIVSAFTFMIIHLTPGDPARVMLGVDAPEEQVEQLREQMGLNRPLPVQYVDWLNDVLHGDLGESIFIDQPLTEIIAERMRPTIELTIFALIIAVVIAIPTGIASARGRGRGIDQGMMVLPHAYSRRQLQRPSVAALRGNGQLHDQGSASLGGGLGV